MSDDLSELQRRMLARQQQHYAQCGVLNGLTLVAALLIVGFVSTLVCCVSTRARDIDLHVLRVFVEVSITSKIRGLDIVTITVLDGIF